MSDFILSVPTKIYFGQNKLEIALKDNKNLFGSSVLIITSGKSIIKNGYLNDLIEKLKNIIPNIYHFGDITPDPDVKDIEKAISLGKKYNVTSVIGFGGGSAIDAAKTAAVCIPNDTDIADYLIGNSTATKNTLPIIAIPTTAGTGAELTKGAIISYKEKNIKSGIRSEFIIPKLAIIDPIYTYTMPLKTTLQTGFDALTHAIESYLSVSANIFSDMLSETAIKNISVNLRKLSKNLDDTNAREMMSYSSMIMGFNVKNVGNCLPHRMQYPIGALTGTTHAEGLISLYPTWFEYEFTVNSERINNIFAWLNLPIAQTSKDAKNIMLSFLDELGIMISLTKLGIKNISATELSQMVTGNLANDKLSNIDNIVEKIYKEALEV